MIACNHHGAPEPHITAFIDSRYRSLESNQPKWRSSWFFFQLGNSHQRTKVPRMFRYTRCSFKKHESFIYPLTSPNFGKPPKDFSKRTFQKKPLDARHWQPSWKTKCSSSPIDWRSGTFETGGWNERIRPLKKGGPFKRNADHLRFFTMFYTKHSRWGVFRKSMPTMFSVEPRYIKRIILNFSIFGRHRQLTHQPWINLKQPYPKFGQQKFCSPRHPVTMKYPATCTFVNRCTRSGSL